MLRLIAYIMGFLFPWKVRRVYLNYFMGFNISPSSKIGFSLVIPRDLEMKEGSRIGHLNVVKGLDLLLDMKGTILNILPSAPIENLF
jgi:hypothetical protein